MASLFDLSLWREEKEAKRKEKGKRWKKIKFMDVIKLSNPYLWWICRTNPAIGDGKMNLDDSILNI